MLLVENFSERKALSQGAKRLPLKPGFLFGALTANEPLYKGRAPLYPLRRAFNKDNNCHAPNSTSYFHLTKSA